MLRNKHTGPGLIVPGTDTVAQFQSAVALIIFVRAQN